VESDGFPVEVGDARGECAGDAAMGVASGPPRDDDEAIKRPEAMEGEWSGGGVEVERQGS